MKSPGNGRDIRPDAPVPGIVPQHGTDFVGTEAQVNREVRRDIPGTVISPLIIRTDFRLQGFHVMDTRQDDRLEGVILPLTALQIFIPQHSEKVQNQLVIRTFIYLINHQHKRFVRFRVLNHPGDKPGQAGNMCGFADRLSNEGGKLRIIQKFGFLQQHHHEFINKPALILTGLRINSLKTDLQSQIIIPPVEMSRQK